MSQVPAYAVLVEGAGYLQTKRRLGPLDTARRFSTHELAEKAAIGYAKRTRETRWMEVVKCSPLQERRQ